MAHDCLKIGREKEKEVAEVLVSYGIIKAYWMPPRAKFYDQDIFGVFDCLAVDSVGAIVGVQVCRKRPSEVHIRKNKLEGFARRLMPAMRCLIAYYDKDGFWLEELKADLEYLFPWRLVGIFPWATTS